MIAEAIQKIEGLAYGRALSPNSRLFETHEFDIYAGAQGGIVRIDKPRNVMTPTFADVESLVAWFNKDEIGAVFAGANFVRAVLGYAEDANRIGAEKIPMSVGTLALLESEAVTTLREFCAKGMTHEALATALNGPLFDRFPDAFFDAISEVEIAETGSVSLSRTRSNTTGSRSVQIKCGANAATIGESYPFQTPLWKRLPYTVALDVRIQVSATGGLRFKGFAVGLEEAIASARTALAADLAKAVSPAPVYVGEPE